MDRESTKQYIKGWEGCEYQSYDDTEGLRTVAVGYCLEDDAAREPIEALGLDFDGVYEGTVTLTDEHCDSLLDTSLDTAIQDAKQYVSNFYEHPDDVQMVIVDMNYNLGGPRFAQFKKAIAGFEALDYCTAAREMGNSKWATQVKRRADSDIAIVQAHCGQTNGG